MSEDEKTEDGSTWPWLLAGLVVVALGAAGWVWLTRPEQAEAAPPPPPPLVETAKARSVKQFEIRQTGFLVPAAEVEVAPEVTARIVEVAPDFEQGRRVDAGDVLIRLDRTRLDAEFGRAEAGAGEARAAVTEARIEADRQRELETRGVSAETVLQQALVALATAEAALTTAEAEVTLARDRLDDAVIRAPFDALVVSADADPGDLAAANASLGTLVAWATAEVELGLLPADLAVLPDLATLPGARVRVVSEGFEPGDVEAPVAEGVVHAVGPQVRDGTRLLPLVVRVPFPFAPGADAPPGARPLRLGELLTLEMPVEVDGAGAVAVPARALRPGGVMWRVEEGRLRRVETEILRREVDPGGERLILRAGRLRPGDVVLLSELPEAADGLPVRVGMGQ